ncbi:hypothetical protein [Streptomyces microflavus]|uniref:hypothetical protein n=1 Tax=Streptomyces microflavus TaxID=1919 RepID=UPI0038120D6E
MTPRKTTVPVPSPRPDRTRELSSPSETFCAPVGLPPDTTAALYRAAALIPGVDIVPDAVDAAGRHGVAVARTHDGERIEWIFDESTVRLLDERTVLVEDNAWGKAGTVVTSVALIDSGIVDEAGQTNY